MFAPVDDRLLLPGYMARPAMIPPDHHHRWKPNVELAPNCPRCDSSNTKFCYYNNYSLTQPRYFCKGCRRYWTKGGSLRNVPVGGGCRKNRRSKSTRLSTDNNPPPPRVERALADPLRPDLALDDMVGRPAGSGGSASSLDASSSTSDGSSIDLALLYNRFLNQCPPLDRGGGGDRELLDMADPSVSGSGCHPAPVQAPDQPSLVMGEFGFGMDPYIYESLPIPAAVPELVVGGGGGVFLSSDQSFPAWEAGPVHHQLGFHPAMEESIGVGHHQHHHHHQDFLIGDWSSLDQSSFEAF